MGSILRNIAIGLFGCLASFQLFAGDNYQWTYSGAGMFPSADAACISKFGTMGESMQNKFTYSHTRGSITWICYAHYNESPADVFENFGTVSRIGTQCPAGTEYNSVTGQCKNPNKCAEYKDETFRGSVDTKPQAYAPSKFSFHGCEAIFTGNTICKVMTSGVGNCNGPAKLTGEPLSEQQESAPDSPDCDIENCEALYPPASESEEPCVENTVAGVTTCTSTKKTSKPGIVNYDNSKDPPTRVENPKATSTEIVTNKTTSTVTGSDGTKTTSTVYVYKTTDCKGVNDCKELTGESTETGVIKPDGTVIPPTTSCTGVGCTGGVPGSSDGDGEGDGDGDNGSASTTGDCAVPPPCEGDLVLCAILGQSHIDTCKLMAGPTAAELGDLAGKTAAEYSALDGHQATLDGQVSTLLSGFESATGGGSGGGGQCLPDVPIDVMGYVVTMEFSRACESLVVLRYAVLAMAYLFAARIVSREV